MADRPTAPEFQPQPDPFFLPRSSLGGSSSSSSGPSQPTEQHPPGRRDAGAWTSTTRATFGELIDGGVLDVTDGYRAKNSELGGTGLIFLRAGHVTDTHIDFAGADRFRDELTPRLEEKLSKAGDVAVTTKGNSTGRTTFVTPKMPLFVYSPHLSRWRSLDYDQLEPGFLRYWSNSREFEIQLRGMAASTDMAPYLSLRDQRRLEITLPPIDEQRAIAGVLGALDDKIEQNRRTAQALERLARAIFRAWFVDFEPVKAKAAGATAFPSMPQPVFDALPCRFVESEIGAVPDGWHVSTVGSCSSYLSRGITPRYVDDGGVLVVNQKCIRDFTINFSKARRHDTRSKKIDKRELAVGDVLINSTGVGTLGRVAQLLRLPRAPVVADSHVTVVRPSASVGWPFLGQALMLSQSVIEAMGEGSTGQTELSRKKISDLRLVVPPAPVLSAFDEDVVPLMQLTSSSSDESQELAELRDYLLSKLLSGTVRVKDAERLLEAAQ